MFPSVMKAFSSCHTASGDRRASLGTNFHLTNNPLWSTQAEGRRLMSSLCFLSRAGTKEPAHPRIIPTPISAPAGAVSPLPCPFHGAQVSPAGCVFRRHQRALGAAGAVETIAAPARQKRACFSSNLSRNPGGAWTCSSCRPSGCCTPNFMGK